MDFIDRLRALSRSAHDRVPHTRTEEAAKTALVMPFLQVLGYDVFDPREVVPEYVADVGTKKGEKVDYAILKDGEPAVIIECKAVGVPLDAGKVTQLFRYFASTPARFGVLTDGMLYRFYSDFEKPNQMDEQPFLEFDLSEITDEDVRNLKRFTKDSFRLEDSLRAAEDLKYTNAIKRLLGDMARRPSPEFVRFIVSSVHGGPKTRARLEKFTLLAGRAFREFINDRVSERLQSALEREGDDSDGEEGEEGTEAGSVGQEAPRKDVETTEEELEAFRLVRELLDGVVDPERVQLHDTPRYCNVNLDGHRFKNIVRFFFNSRTKWIGIRKGREQPRYRIGCVEEIMDYAPQIRERVEALL